MPGIAGIGAQGRQAQVERMLGLISHRGRGGRAVFEVKGATLGAVWQSGMPPPACRPAAADNAVRDASGGGRLAEAQVIAGRLRLSRDPLGVAPLYYGRTADGAVCFASEVKALAEMTRAVSELPPGHTFDGVRCQAYARPQKQPLLDGRPEEIATELRRRLEAAVRKCIGGTEAGAWLSGGLDSSTMAALARPHVNALHTFAAGLAGAPDLEYARAAAEHLGSQHHEAVPTAAELLAVLPEVIRHLESFDALLVRSSVTNYLVGRLAAEHVPEVLSGEGGDELFAGYEYLKALPAEQLPDELLDITGRLHNTALQRVDRCSAAHGLLAHVPFLDADVADYALRIPPGLKIRGGVEKWILRRAIQGALPQAVLDRPKSKFWEGAGVGDLLARHAEGRITPSDFQRERRLPNGWLLATPEELLYYRIFKEHFGGLADLSWVGRTKGAPAVPAA
ncbi:MAG: asparagine synthase [Planctomycetes bacterium]|nr:asparagine synthase [Planctomycetota bacterium]